MQLTITHDDVPISCRIPTPLSDVDYITNLSYAIEGLMNERPDLPEMRLEHKEEWVLLADEPIELQIGDEQYHGDRIVLLLNKGNLSQRVLPRGPPGKDGPRGPVGDKGARGPRGFIGKEGLTIE